MVTPSALLAAGIPLAWLLPNHYFPWVSAWQDGLALALLLAAAALCGGPVRISWPWVAIGGTISASVALQSLTGTIYFRGDALLVLLYVAAFILALGVGNALIRRDAADASSASLEVCAIATVLSAIGSVGLVLVQWTGLSVGLLGTDLPPGARPFGNVSQPNHLCSLLFLGLCAAMLLKESGRIGRAGFWLTALFLLQGMVMSGSRTGWLQMGGLLVVGSVLGRRAQTEMRAPQLLVLVALFSALTLAWPLVNEAVLLTGGRGVTQQIDGGARAPLWRLLLDAVGREPLWGYGWQQATLAQQAVALDHPPIQRHFEHSHNLVLDLVLWAGIPVAGLISSLAAYAMFRLLRSTRDPRALWLTAGVLGLLAHSMVEFPLEYAYFLLPAGLALGSASALSADETSGKDLPTWTLRAAGSAGLVLLSAMGVEYLEAEQSHRLLRLESARIGTTRVESVAPDLKLLTQLGAFLSFARTEARAGMSPRELESLRRAAQRFNYPPSMLRHALAAGLNGHPQEARQTLQRLCRIHPKPRCDEAREAWRALQRLHPVLQPIPLP